MRRDEDRIRFGFADSEALELVENLCPTLVAISVKHF